MLTTCSSVLDDGICACILDQLNSSSTREMLALIINSNCMCVYVYMCVLMYECEDMCGNVFEMTCIYIMIPDAKPRASSA